MNLRRSEIENWDAFVEGNKAGFEYLYNTYYTHLQAYAGKFLDDPVLVQESIQDLFVKLWNNKANLGRPASVKHYLLKSLRNLVYNKLSARQRIKHIGGIEEFDSFNLVFDDPRSLTAAQPLSAALQHKINSLTPRQKEIIYLFYVEDLSYDEIAEILDMNKGGAYKLLYRALESLRLQFFSKKRNPVG